MWIPREFADPFCPGLEVKAIPSVAAVAPKLGFPAAVWFRPQNNDPLIPAP
jgi:hypothetical protein